MHIINELISELSVPLQRISDSSEEISDELDKLSMSSVFEILSSFETEAHHQTPKQNTHGVLKDPSTPKKKTKQSKITLNKNDDEIKPTNSSSSIIDLTVTPTRSVSDSLISEGGSKKILFPTKHTDTLAHDSRQLSESGKKPVKSEPRKKSSSKASATATVTSSQPQVIGDSRPANLLASGKEEGIIQSIKQEQEDDSETSPGK